MRDVKAARAYWHLRLVQEECALLWTVIGLVLVCLVTIAAVAFPIWAIVDAAGHPEEEWRAVGRRHTTWIFALVVGTFVFLVAGIVTAVLYCVLVRPELARVGGRGQGTSGASDDPSDTLCYERNL